MVTVDFHELELKPRALVVAEVPGWFKKRKECAYSLLQKISRMGYKV